MLPFIRTSKYVTVPFAMNSGKLAFKWTYKCSEHLKEKKHVFRRRVHYQEKKTLSLYLIQKRYKCRRVGRCESGSRRRRPPLSVMKNGLFS